MNALRERIRTFIDRLEPRERLLVSLAAGVALLVLVYAVLVMPIAHAYHAAAERVAKQESALAQGDLLAKKYEMIKGDLAAAEKEVAAGTRGNLLTILESLAHSSKIKVDSMQPQAGASNELYRETKVQIEIKGVTLAQLVQYLFAIESTPQRISVKSLRLNRQKDPSLLDVSFSVSSFEPV